MRRGLTDPHKGSLDERRKRHRTEVVKRLRHDERRTVSQNPGGVLSRCVGQDKAHKKLKEVHDKTCGSCGEISLYRRLQIVGFYWPNMGKDADQVQTQCGACQLTADREESYAVFISEN